MWASRVVWVCFLLLSCTFLPFDSVRASNPAFGSAPRVDRRARQAGRYTESRSEVSSVNLPPLSSDTVAEEDVMSDEVDEQLYSRQLFVYGRSAQKRLSASHVLLYGGSSKDDSLLAEVAKNLALAGVGKLSIRMPAREKWTNADLIGESSDLVAYCAEINPFVQARGIKDGFRGAIDFSGYSVVVVCDADTKTLTKLNAQSRRVGIPLVAVQSIGLSGYIFNDFGDQFEVEDAVGETSKEVPLHCARILEDADSLSLQCIEEETFGLGIGDRCEMTMDGGIDGESTLVTAEVVSVTSPTSIAVKLLGEHGVEKQGWQIAERLSRNLPVLIKKGLEALTMNHVPLEQALESPSFTQSNGCLSPRLDRAWSLCLLSAFLTVQGEPHAGGTAHLSGRRHTPRSLRTGMLARLIGMGVKKPLDTPRAGGVGAANIDRLIASSLLRSSQGDMNTGVCPATISVLGPMAAQEAIKAVTHIHHPVSQFFVFESLDSVLPGDTAAAPTASHGGEASRGTVYGEEVRKELAGLRIFVVGSGAIGCELLKTFSLMGVAQGSPSGGDSRGLWSKVGRGGRGGVILTDMDSIERSNLNRQLLFRQRHIGQPKAVVAAEMAAKLNPLFSVHALTSKVSPETEHLFDDAFWEDVDVVVTALDNVDARRYVDEKCVQYQKILLDSGTLGTKGNTQVVLPFLSESYASSADPPEEAIPLCTLKSFPYLSDHCVSWAKALFTQCFNDDVESLRSALAAAAKPGNALDRYLENVSADDIERLDNIVQLLGKYSTQASDQTGGAAGDIAEEKQRALSQWTLGLFHKVFRRDMQALLAENPADKVDEDGEPFWGGSRRMPQPCKMDVDSSWHLVFAAQSIRLVCRTYGLAKIQPISAPDKPEEDPLIPRLRSLLASEMEPSLCATSLPAAELLPQLTEAIRYLAQQHPGLLLGLSSEEFEKDDLSLGHVAFAAAASNIRCDVYSLPQVDSLHVQRVAGNIVPAVATTTSLVAGLVCLELVKVASERVSFRKKMDIVSASQGEGEGEVEVKGWRGRENAMFTDFAALSITDEQQQAAEVERLLARFRNTFVNLARPLLAFAQPVQVEGYSSPAEDEVFTMWSVIEIDNEGIAPSVEILERALRSRLGQPELELQSVSLGDSLIFASFLHPPEQAMLPPVQTLLLQGRASSSVAESGEDEEDSGGKEGALERLDGAVRELSRAFVDLDVVCTSQEGEDYTLPRLRLRVDAELLLQDAAEMRQRIEVEEGRRDPATGGEGGAIEAGVVDDEDILRGIKEEIDDEDEDVPPPDGSKELGKSGWRSFASWVKKRLASEEEQ